MIATEIIAGLNYYGLTIVRKEKNYCLVEIETGECYEDMSIYYIRTLLSNWTKLRNSA